MQAVKPEPEMDVDLKKGNRCLLNLLGQHYMVTLLDVREHDIRTSFPGRDYPVEGMPVSLEFHDEAGFNEYPARVLEGPAQSGEGILLAKPGLLKRNHHRGSCRVPTDLTAQVKEQTHVRRYDAALVNLSGGGALLQTNAPFDFDMVLELFLSLPGELTHMILAKVVYVGATPESSGRANLFGVSFMALPPAVEQSIARYIWKRLRELYAEA